MVLKQNSGVNLIKSKVSYNLHKIGGKITTHDGKARYGGP